MKPTSPIPDVYTTTEHGLRFYEETALRYIHDGRRRFTQAVILTLLLGAGTMGAVRYLGDTGWWSIALMAFPLGWGVSGGGQWFDGRQYLVKIEAQRHYRERDIAEAARLAPATAIKPTQLQRAPAGSTDGDDDDGKLS